MDTINKILALPKTHKVTTIWTHGLFTEYHAHSAASAENYAVRMRRAITAGEAVSVEVQPL